MTNAIYLTLKGQKQGEISTGCGSYDSIGNKFQAGHEDQIMVYSLAHNISREQHTAHQPFTITKPIDKSTPLIGMGITNNEEMYLLLDFYRTSNVGAQEKYFSIEIRKAKLKRVALNYPHALTNNDSQPEEILSVVYQDIKWQHHIAGTTGYSLWEDRVY
jgi:type VI secretion system Hcp family effector